MLRQICLQPHREEALASAREAVEIAERMDSAPAEGAARIILGAVSFVAGRWDDAERELTSEAARVRAPSWSPLIMRRVTLARPFDARGRTDEAETVLAEIDAATFPHGAVWPSTMPSSHHPATGDLDAARRHLDTAREAQATLHVFACKALSRGAGRRDPGGDRDPDGAGAGRSGRRGRRRRSPGSLRLMAARGRGQRRDPGLEAWDTAVAEASAALPLADTVAQPSSGAAAATTRHNLSRGRQPRRAAGRPGSLPRASSPKRWRPSERLRPAVHRRGGRAAGPAGRPPGDSRPDGMAKDEKLDYRMNRMGKMTDGE